ncbi:MAG: nucleotide-binding protein [Spirochaetales bacterium]|jgi:predicted nucleotide-binding protein|nr:nucleotide-binding protein [Spirochaetales bacterium]
MPKSIEKVFIVWGGNKPLADMVSAKLGEHGFDGVVGGGTPTDMYIGTQIFSQIAQCTRAIILVQDIHHELGGVFSNNLMFEWGYLTAKMDPRKLHIFLIGDLSKNLPSDLAGIWASEIKEGDKTPEQIAKDIADIFFRGGVPAN